MIGMVLKVSAVLLVALAGACGLRRQSAALRHWILASGVVLAAATPALMAAVPVWHVATQARLFRANARADRGPDSRVTTSVAFDPVGVDRADGVAAARSSAGPRSPIAIARAVWIAGAACWIAVLVVGFVRLRWLTRDASEILSGPWFEAATRLSVPLRMRRRVRLFETRQRTLLVTWGFARPRIVLPAAASGWPADRIHIVLAHELAHIRRADWLLQTVAELLRAIYWFNPLAWLAADRLRRESECACDDAVLDTGVDACAYASHLVELARALNTDRHRWLSAPAMARRSSLEGRVRAMLNPALNRTAPALWGRVAATLLVFGAAAPIAAMAPPQTTFSTLSGTVLDQTNRGVPGVPVAVTETARHEKHEVLTDRSGRYEIVGLTPGDYALQVDEPGFAPFRTTIIIGAGPFQQDVTLRLASLQETIRIQGGAKPPELRPDAKARVEASQARYQQAVGRCREGVRNDTGGNILAPLKLVDVKPVYPDALKNANIGGVVTLDAVIGVDGLVRDVRTVSSPDPQLDQAAAAAVWQWQFTPTLLNCTPIDVTMHVTTTFVPQP